MSALWVIYLFILQAFDPFNLSRTQRERYNARKEFLIANRGNIYDANEELLVTTMKYYQIDLDVKVLRDRANRENIEVTHYYDLIANIIADHTTLDRNNLYQRLLNNQRNTLFISENIDETQITRIKEDFARHRLNNLVINFSSSRRVYTKGNLAARLLGLTHGLTDTSKSYNRFTFRLEGLSGIEKAFDRDLFGTYGWREAFFTGEVQERKIPIANPKTKPVRHGSSIYLTIDSRIQEILENNLRKGLSQYGAKNAIGVIMNPHNGDVIAMAGVSSQDRHRHDNQIRSLPNMPTQFLFEPGSTIKPFVSLLALERNLVRENEMIDCRPMHINYSSHRRTISDTRNLGTISLKDIIAFSSNVGIAKIADRIGTRDLYRHYLNLGFGTATSIDLDYESSGIFRKLSDWTQYTLHSVSFGQEMSVTALQLANAFCALANGGTIYKPNIIKKKVDENGRVYFTSDRKAVKNVSNRKAIALNNTFLLEAVERGTGGNTRFQNIKVAGKTGTSEKVVNGSYSKTAFTASFAGFFPYEKPKYVMVIVYDEPAFNFRFGSVSAASTFRNVVEEMITLPDCTIIPDMKLYAQNIITMPRLTGLKIDAAKKILNTQNIKFKIYNESPDGYILHQFPQPGTRFGSNNQISLYAHKERNQRNQAPELQDDIMPNLVGMSIRQAINVTKALKVNLRIEGSGHVVSQTIRPGEKLKLQQTCLIVAR
jgi:cell division protein FtsI/penicillin-binding protein 2